MAASTKWVLGPDGFDAREVGPWVHRKVHHIDRLLDIFATAMRTKWPHRAYVELFAGPGLSRDRVSGDWVVGSARRAIAYPFTDYLFVDMDPRATAALTARLRADGVDRMPDKWVGVTTRDCNDAVDAIRTRIPKGALSLVFVDPTTWQVRFDSIAHLVDGRHTDLLYTFHVGSMRRVGNVPAPELNDFFGTDRWRTAVRRPYEQRAQALVDLYNEQLAGLGYLPTSFESAVPVKNSKGVTMYVLILFSKHALGAKFWREAMAVNELGQRTLWDLAPPG